MERCVGSRYPGARIGSANKPNRCRATTKSGAPCQSFAVERGLCAVHSGRVNPAEIGAKGGRGRTVATLGISDAIADDKLRLQAKRALEESLNSDNEQVRLRAAQSLYSYRAAQPPAEEHGHDGHPRPVTRSGRRVTNLTDVLAFGLEVAPKEMEAMIARARERANSPGNEQPFPKGAP